MRRVGDAGSRGNAPKGVWPRGAGTGVDKQRLLAALQIEYVFDLQLEVFDQLELIGQIFIFEPFFQLTAKHRPNGIIAAAGVADGKDDDRRTHPSRLSE